MRTRITSFLSITIFPLALLGAMVILGACSPQPTPPPTSTPTPVPTVYPESLSPQAGPVCEAGFAVSNPVTTALAERPVLLVTKEVTKDEAGTWQGYRLGGISDRSIDRSDESAVATSAADVKTLVCIREIFKGDGVGVLEVRLVKWPEGTVVGHQDFRVYSAGSIFFSSEQPGVVERYFTNYGFYIWLTAMLDHLRVLISEDAVADIAFSPDGKILASSAFAYSEGKLWDMTTGQQIRSFEGQAPLAFSPDGQTLALQFGQGIRLLDVGTGEEMRNLIDEKGKGSIPYFRSLTFSPDGKSLATGGDSGSVQLWDVMTGNELHNLTGDQGPVYSVVFTSDGKSLAAGTSHGSVLLWDVASGQKLYTLVGREDQVSSTALSPDGKILASASKDGTVKLLDVMTGDELHKLTGDQGSVYSMAFASDGKRLAAGTSRSVLVWDVASGLELHRFVGHRNYVQSVAFSPDGKVLASESHGVTGGTAHSLIVLWDATNGK